MSDKDKIDITNESLADIWEEFKIWMKDFMGEFAKNFLDGFLEFLETKEVKKLQKKLTEEELLELYAACDRILKPKGVNKK